MARRSNPKTSLRVARIASRLLRTPGTSKAVKRVAGAALGGRRPKRGK